MMKHWGWRVAAALPLVAMSPVLYAGFDPDSYGHGSLYGVGLYFVYVPAMVYLAIFCLVGLVNRSVRANRENSDTSTANNENADAETGMKSQTHTVIVLVVLAAIVFLGLMLIPFR